MAKRNVMQKIREDLHAFVDRYFDDLESKISSFRAAASPRPPSVANGQQPRAAQPETASHDSVGTENAEPASQPQDPQLDAFLSSLKT